VRSLEARAHDDDGLSTWIIDGERWSGQESIIGASKAREKKRIIEWEERAVP